MVTRATLIGLLFLGCSPASVVGDCSPKNCLGCCDSAGTCQSGVKKAACGSGGFTCFACASNQLCGAKSTCELDPNAPLDVGGGTATGGGSVGGGSAGATGGGAATADQEFVNAHNAARRRATPAPNPALPAVSWDTATAAFAKAGADRCIFSHRQQNQYGENLYAGTNEPTPTEVVDSWDSEKQFYTYATNGCSNVCGHYTQVVWRSSVKIGCATTRCTSGSPFGGGAGAWYLTACNYSPPGNYVGQKPY